MRDLASPAARWPVGSAAVLLVIFGAGASYDSLPDWADVSHERAHKMVGENMRPPLASQLFDNRSNFTRVLDDLPEAAPLMMPMRSAAERGQQVESVLAELQTRARQDRPLEIQLRAFRFYLLATISECSEHWPYSLHAPTNYDALIWHIQRWQEETSERVLYVTFNYDTLLERALHRNYGFPMNPSPADYVSDKRFRVIKPHGSVNWGRVVRAAGVIPSGSLQDSELWARSWMIHEMPLKAVTDEYVALVGPGFYVIQSEGREPTGGLRFPAIAVPVNSKELLECPQTHQDKLKEWLPEVDRALIIGWRGSEPTFRDLLLEASFPSNVRTHVASPTQESFREVATKLAPLALNYDPDVKPVGFTTYLSAAIYDSLLA